MVVFHEGQDVTRRLIHRGPTPREPLGDDDFLAPALAAIFAATNADVLAVVRFKDALSPGLQPSDHDRSVESRYAIRLAAVFSRDRLQLEVRFTQKGLQPAF